MKKIDKTRDSLNRLLEDGRYVRWGLLILVTAILGLSLHPSLVITAHDYEIGDVAERDIKAPREFLVENKALTEENRRQAIEGVITVYDHDPALITRIQERVSRAFGMLRQAMEAPPPDAARAEENTQTPLENRLPPLVAGKPSGAEEKTAKKSVHERVWELKDRFEEQLGISVSKGAFALLEKEGFSEQIPARINQILEKILENGVVSNKELLLREGARGIALRNVETQTEKVVTDLKRFYGTDQAKIMVRVVGNPLLKDMSYTLVNLIVDFAQRLIQPNITLNRNETEERKKEAAETVKSAYYQVKAGEMLLREGERVTPLQLLKLKTLYASSQQKNLLERSLGAVMLIGCFLIICYLTQLPHLRRNTTKQNKDLLFIGVMLVIFFILPRVSAFLFEVLIRDMPFSISTTSMSFGIPLAASAMTVCMFMGLDIAIAFSLLVSVCAALIFQNRFDLFLYFLMSCIMGAYWTQDCRERKVFIKAGAKLGLLNLALATAVNVYTNQFTSLFWDWGFAFLGGLGAGIVTAGLAPLMEMAFNYTTDISLLELSNLEQPLLRRLMIEAPGTYHHSVLVGSMVEAAAAEIGANPLLAKVCAYYHDIGKLKMPLYFVENQTDGKNRHDKLAPSMSSLILISHVKDGVEMAKKHKLGQVIIDAIRQHHGTSLIRYFYEKAKQLKGEDAVKIDDFRYPGPRPQTREAGLVMLADVVEAASRTLENPTPSRIQGHVQKLINAIFSDGQLDNCELTLKDLHKIANSFNKILNGIHHHRIEYDSSGAKPLSKQVKKERKEKNNGHSDRKPAPERKDAPGKAQAEGSGHLKRLGVSGG